MAENAQEQAPEPTGPATAPEAKSADNMESQIDKPSKPAAATAAHVMAAAAHVIAPGVLSIFSFFLSLALLGCSVWLLFVRSYDCEGILGLTRVQTLASIGLLAVFCISNGGLYFRRRFPMLVLVVMVVTLLLMLFLGLAYSGVSDLQSQRFPATVSWFKLQVTDDSNWNNIKTCIYDEGACDELIYKSIERKSYDLISKSKMNSIQSGCCMPPKTCEREQVNVTSRGIKDDEPPPEMEGRLMGYAIDDDCELWRNKWTVLCYDCRACKVGFIKTLRRKWWKLGVFCIVMSILLLLSHLFLFLATFWELLKS